MIEYDTKTCFCTEVFDLILTLFLKFWTRIFSNIKINPSIFLRAMDHAELIAELPRIEALTPQERLRLAKERRALQLRRCLQLEKEQEGRRKSAVGLSSKKKILNSRRIKFPDTIRLLEAAARNDIDEGK